MKKAIPFKTIKTILLLITCFVIFCFCSSKPDQHQNLFLFTDENETQYGYKNESGDTVIALGKYDMCFTDTFKSYAIVADKNGIVAINQQEKVLYPVFVFDNGPDYPSQGLFRIIKNGKIGYADELTGKVIIHPQFDCAWPFENGKAKVSKSCTKTNEFEMTKWESDQWYYIDKKGMKIN